MSKVSDVKRQMENIFIIIPAYNEESVILQTLLSVRDFYPNVVLVDDGSTDKTAEEARKLDIPILQHIVNRGQGAALRTGINYAIECGADIIVTYDADGQFKPEEIKAICQPIIDGECDIVLGTRFRARNRIPFLKRVILKIAVLFTRVITGLNITDAHNGFRAFSRQAAKKIKIRQDRMAHASDILHQIAKLKLKYKEVPVTVRYTEYSKGKGQKISGALRILWDLIFK